MSTENMISIAKYRDAVEKYFMFIKTHFDLDRTVVRNENTYEGKMFVSFIALVLLQPFRWFRVENKSS